MTGPASSDDDRRLTIFTAYLEDLGRIGSRHEATRSFYLSVISALFVLLGLAGTTGPLAGAPPLFSFIVGGVGILICVAWHLHMRSYSEIYTAKKETLQEIEKNLPAKPFTVEAGKLDSKHLRLTWIDQFIAVLCASLFIGVILFRINSSDPLWP